MFSLFRQIEARARHRATLHKCKRCGLLFEKTLDQCPHCNHLDDINLSRQLAERARFRLSLGKAMFLAAILIIIIMLLAAS